jgi:hypothetical protein
LRIDWRKYGLTDADLTMCRLKRFSYEEPRWHRDEGRPLFMVDELILAAWAPLRFAGSPFHYVHHIDGNYDNCRLDNLRYASSAQAERAHSEHLRGIEENQSALVNPRQSRCRASTDKPRQKAG